jgi:hypothetical protein
VKNRKGEETRLDAVTPLIPQTQRRLLERHILVDCLVDTHSNIRKSRIPECPENGFGDFRVATGNSGANEIEGFKSVSKADDGVDCLLGVLDGGFGGDLDHGCDEVIEIEEGLESFVKEVS